MIRAHHAVLAAAAVVFLITGNCSGGSGSVLKSLQQEDALRTAARNGDLKKVEVLVSDGVNVNARDKFGTTALMFAADRGHDNVLKFLLASGALVNTKDEWGSTALSRAEEKGHTQTVTLLRKAGGTSDGN